MTLASPNRFNPKLAVIQQRFETDLVLDKEFLSPEQIRYCLSKNIAWTPQETDENRHIKESNQIKQKELDGLETRAAVMIPILLHNDEPTILFTVRSISLSSHAGQISFPGGRFSPEDKCLIETAKREVKEEVGINSEDIEVLGSFPEYCTISGYRVTPVIALVRPQSSYILNFDEVSDIFEVPISYLLNPKNLDLRSWESEQGRRHFYTITYEKHLIWGATAAILRNFYLYLRMANNAV